MSLFVTIVLDGVGIGAQPDAHLFGDAGSNTLGHVCRQERPPLPNLERLGLGCIAPLDGVRCSPSPRASVGKMLEVSPGKDSTTGHWELSGIVLKRPFPTYPDGFPPVLVDRFIEQTGCAGALGNRAASGTQIIQQFGSEHLHSGRPIVYTSADSVFQVAAHKQVIPLERLYDICRIARERVCVGEHAVGRVIARPFVSENGRFVRVSAERRDYALAPTDAPIQQRLADAGVRCVSVGKVADLFGGVGFSEVVTTKGNEDGVRRTLEVMRSAARDGRRTFVWVNLIDFDQEYGHRNDARGFAQALAAFDAAVPSLLDALPIGGALCITADHGNDPTFPGTDHTREYVPVLFVAEGRARQLGVRVSFADHAATAAEFFGIQYAGPGLSLFSNAVD